MVYSPGFYTCGREPFGEVRKWKRNVKIQHVPSKGTRRVRDRFYRSFFVSFSFSDFIYPPFTLIQLYKTRLQTNFARPLFAVETYDRRDANLQSTASRVTHHCGLSNIIAADHLKTKEFLIFPIILPFKLIWHYIFIILHNFHCSSVYLLICKKSQNISINTTGIRQKKKGNKFIPTKIVKDIIFYFFPAQISRESHVIRTIYTSFVGLNIEIQKKQVTCYN